jgi:hypothetical protein
LRRARLSLDAIRVLRTLERDQRPATVAEQKILAGYVDWGAVRRPISRMPRRLRTITLLLSAAPRGIPVPMRNTREPSTQRQDDGGTAVRLLIAPLRFSISASVCPN